MIRFIGRCLINIFILLLIIIGLVRTLNYDEEAFSQIEQFIVSATDCEASICFLGVVINQSIPNDIITTLNQSDYVADVNIRAVGQSEREINWVWNGEQPDIFQDGSYVAIFYGPQAELIHLETTLNLGETILILDNPDYVFTTLRRVVLYYEVHNMYIQILPNCEAVWYSPVSIDIRPFVNPPDDTISLDEALIGHCR